MTDRNWEKSSKMSDASKSWWAAVRFWNQFSNGSTPVTSYIAHCTLLPSLHRELWSFIERGGSKLLIEMGQRGSSGCKFILIPQRDVRDYSRAPSWQGKDLGQVITLDSGGTFVIIYQLHKMFCFYFWSWFVFSWNRMTKQIFGESMLKLKTM